MEMPIISIIPVPITSVIANTSSGKSYKDARDTVIEQTFDCPDKLDA